MRDKLKRLVAGAIFAFTANAYAGVFTPNATYDAPDANTADGICADSLNKCTLRAAIQQANAASGLSYVFLTAGQSYALNSPLEVQGNIVILTPGPTPMEVPTIKAAEGVNTRLIIVEGTGQLTIIGARLTGGRIVSGDNGGGIGGAGMLIKKGATVTLDRVEVSNNIVDRKNGGGIYNDGILKIIQSNISNNKVSDWEAGIAPQAYYGGGLANTGLATIIASSFINNSSRYGGAIASTRGYIDGFGATKTNILASTIHNNRASYDGAAIYSYFSEVEIIGSTIIQNGKNSLQESKYVLNDVAAISVPIGDARYDNGVTPNANVGEVLFNSTCASCHGATPIHANHYDEKALFAFIDTIMSSYSNCELACAQHVAAYLVSDLYTAAPEAETGVIFESSPNIYIATSIIVNNDDVPEYKKGRSIPDVTATLWGAFPTSSDTSISDFHTYYWPAQLTTAEQSALTFSFVPTTSSFVGVNTVVAKPITGTTVWKESINFSLCKNVAQQHNLYSYNLSRYCKHGESAGNTAPSYRAAVQEYTYGSYYFSLGAWEDSR